MDRDRVLGSYAEGVDSIVTVAAKVEDWSAPTPCAAWTAHDVAGHVLAIARYYNGILDAVESGHPRRELPRGQGLEAMNGRDLAALPATSGPERIGEFAKLARHYQDRLEKVDWLTVLGYWAGLGPLTVAGHTGLAVGEWHIHAWDLGQSIGLDHRPTDPEVAAAARAAVPTAFLEGDPWDATLVWSGRHLGTDPDRS